MTTNKHPRGCVCAECFSKPPKGAKKPAKPKEKRPAKEGQDKALAWLTDIAQSLSRIAAAVEKIAGIEPSADESE